MNRQCVVRWLPAVLLICATLPRFAAAADPAAASAIAAPVFDLLVTGPDDKPISGAAITAYVDGKNTKNATNAAGHALIPMPKQPTSNFTVMVQASQFVQKSVDWRSPKNDPIPATYTLKLEPGVRVTGKVIDDAGQPVKGAHVEVWISKQAPASHERSGGNASMQTDANGIWTYDNAPQDGEGVRAGAWDYHYANGDFYNLEQLTPQQVKDGSFTITLARGVAVDGVVLKPDGTPLSGARVALGGEMASNRIPPVKTDKDGQFEYFAVPGAQVVLTITSKGYATELTNFVMGNDKHDVSIQMTKSTPIVGHVVDPDGKPVPNAWVYPDTWRGFRSLEVRLHADKNGKFTWADPPTDTVLCDVEAPGTGFIRSRNVPITVSDQEVLITIQRSPPVHGTVVDAETNQPIQSFNVIEGISFSKDQPTTWQRQQMFAGHAGKFEFSLSFPYPGYAVRIEADGYTPSESRVFADSEKDVNLEFKMKKGQGTSITVLTADGKAVAGATAYMLVPGQGISTQNGRLRYRQDATTATTDAQGKCSFPPDSAAFTIFVLQDEGYAEISSANLGKSGEIRLIPWAHVHGKLMIGAKPWASQQIMGQIIEQAAYDRSRPRVFQQLTATTDAQGEFTFDRVPAGTIQVAKQIEGGVGRMRFSTMGQSEQVVVEPGKTAEITIGGKGRPVEGQVEIPPEIAARQDWMWGWNTQANRQQMANSWLGAMLASTTKPTTQQALANLPRNYPLEIGKDGKFRIEDVVPGTYNISFNIVAVSGNQNVGLNMNDVLAEGRGQFTVAEIPGDRTDDVQALPPFKIAAVARVDVGSPAPDFPAKTADGKDIKLSDFKGKYVLVNFLHAGLTAEQAEIPTLKAANASFGGDDRFAMLTIDISGTPGDLTKYTQANGITWQSACLSAGRNSMQQYGIRQLPFIYLVGPDGKVVAKEMHGDAIKAALTTALGPQGL